MRFIKKFSIGLGFIITAVAFFILGSATIIGIDVLYDRGMHRQVKVI